MRYWVEITSLAYGGDGIGRIDGQVCFVPFAFPGDVAEVEITRKAKQVLWGRITAIAEASPDRLETAPPGHAGVCGGCHWIQFAYPAQADWKQRLVREALLRYAGLEADLTWEDDPAQRIGWRTRADVHGDGVRLGFFALGSHEIVDSACPLTHPKLAAAIERLRAAGWRQDVTLTVDPDGNAVLAFGRGPTREARACVTAWDTPRGDGTRAQFMHGGAPVVNGCFSQAGLGLNRLLQRAVARMVTGNGPLFDAYCGNGNLSLGFTGQREVLGLDISAGAADAARAISGDYREGDEFAMAAALCGRAWGTILLDPPRAGARALIAALAAAQADEIIYVSCDPVALARDLKGIAAGGWQITHGTVLDLFPNTSHVETVVRLERA